MAKKQLHPSLGEILRPTPAHDYPGQLLFLEALEHIDWTDGVTPLKRLKHEVWPVYHPLWQLEYGFLRFQNPPEVVRFEQLQMSDSQSVRSLDRLLRQWATECNISPNDRWLFEAALQTLDSFVPRDHIDDDKDKSWRRSPRGGWHYAPPFLRFELRLPGWDGIEWGEYHKMARRIFEGRLRFHREQVEKRFTSAERRSSSTIHARWTAQHLSGLDFIQIAQLHPTGKKPTRQSVREAVLKYAKRIGITLPARD